jgi:hypothetical protein
MSWVKELVEEYKLDDPTEGNDYGEFTNSDLQQLYYSLIEEGILRRGCTGYRRYDRGNRHCRY